MECHLVEATNGFNWGKFMLARFTPEEWELRSKVDGRKLLHSRGWSPDHLLVWDLQTGEGALFRPGGSASADLHKHRIWVCPMFEPYLTWLYKQDLKDLGTIPQLVELPDAESSMFGYRRPGPVDQEVAECLKACSTTETLTPKRSFFG